MLTLWCVFGSPLMIGAELTKLDEWTLSLLTNREVLRMLTPECRARQLCLDDKKAVWRACNEREGTKYAAMFNLEEKEAWLSVGLQEAGFKPDDLLTELWTGETREISDGILRAKVPAHGCVVYAVRQSF